MVMGELYCGQLMIHLTTCIMNLGRFLKAMIGVDLCCNLLMIHLSASNMVRGVGGGGGGGGCMKPSLQL